ncbi:MAG: hypothetical protein U5L11_09450 [Arhodomonas sp.]|nr:hypothetical protein [Arhodomonas sp.]
MPAAVPRCRCAISPASPSSSSVSARRPTRWSPSTRTGSPRASSAWAMCSRLVEEAERQVDQREGREARAQAARRARASIWRICATRCSRCRAWAAWAALMDKLPGMGKHARRGRRARWTTSQCRAAWIAIINSMTPWERRKPDLIKGARKRRIAAGSGTQVQDVNRLLKQHKQMQKMMKKMKGGGMQKMMRQLGAGGGGFPPGGGMPPGGDSLGVPGAIARATRRPPFLSRGFPVNSRVLLGSPKSDCRSQGINVRDGNHSSCT